MKNSTKRKINYKKNQWNKNDKWYIFLNLQIKVVELQYNLNSNYVIYPCRNQYLVKNALVKSFITEKIVINTLWW